MPIYLDSTNTHVVKTTDLRGLIAAGKDNLGLRVRAS